MFGGNPLVLNCGLLFQQEAGENKIKLDEDDPQVVEAMLHYLYHGTYGDAGNATTDLPSILLDVKVFVIADKYFVEPLKAVACRKFGEHCKDEWKTADFAQAVQELYESGVEDKSLKDVALAAVRIHAKDLLTKNGEFPDIHKAMRETPAFGADVLTDLTAASNAFSTDIDRPTATSETLREMYRWTFRCPNCLSTFSVDIPLGSSVEFGCPKGHSRDESFFFWKKYST